MKKTPLLMALIVVCGTAAFCSGCGKKEPAESEPAQANIQSMDELRAQARQEITADNAEEELKKLQAEIDAETK